MFLWPMFLKIQKMEIHVYFNAIETLNLQAAYLGTNKGQIYINPIDDTQ